MNVDGERALVAAARDMRHRRCNHVNCTPNLLQVVNVDGERALVAVRATGGSADASLGAAHMAASVAVGSFEIEDLLVGARCPAHAYLARSFEARSGGAPDCLCLG